MLRRAGAGPRRDHHFWLRCRAEALAIGAADGVSSPSQAALDVVRQSYGLALPDAAVIPNPVTVASAAEAWTLAGCDRDTILFVGRFNRVKGADTVLDAFGLLARTYPRARLLFAGPDMGLYEGDRIWTMPQYLEARLPAEVRGRVNFLGSLPRAEVERVRKQALVTVVASRFETFGMVALEAMAAGAPLVTSRAGGLAEIGTPGVHCLAFASRGRGRSGGEGRQPARGSRAGRPAGRGRPRRGPAEVCARGGGAAHGGVLPPGAGQGAGVGRRGGDTELPRLPGADHLPAGGDRA